MLLNIHLYVLRVNKIYYVVLNRNKKHKNKNREPTSLLLPRKLSKFIQNNCN